MDKPTIRILQRPCPIAANNFPISTSSPSSTIKTLEQREADYAAARRRIMGSETSESEEVDVPNLKDNEKKSAIWAEQNGNSANRLPTTSQNIGATPATPLMSIQAVPVTTSAAGLASDFGLTSNTPVCNGGNSIQSRTGQNTRRALAIVNVAQKLQQQPQPSINVTHPTAQQRTLTASASSPSMFAHSARSAPQPVPLFPTQMNSNTNTGLLPSVPGFNYALPGTSVTGGGMPHSHSAVLAVLQQCGLLQQYQQTMNGFQNQLLPSMVNTSTFSQTNFPSVASQPNKKFAYPPAFN